MSRFGRDYLKVGFYTEVMFKEKGVRFIAINNGIDSANQQDSDFTPFLNIINEMFSLRMEAFVIQYSPRIYNKSVSPVLSARPQSAVRLSRFCQSAGYLNERGLPPPIQYARSNGLDGNFDDGNGSWNSRSVKYILTNRTYTGMLVQGKEKRAVEATHEPLVDFGTFDAIQKEFQARATMWFRRGSRQIIF